MKVIDFYKELKTFIIKKNLQNIYNIENYKVSLHLLDIDTNKMDYNSKTIYPTSIINNNDKTLHIVDEISKIRKIFNDHLYVHTLIECINNFDYIDMDIIGSDKYDDFFGFDIDKINNELIVNFSYTRKNGDNN